MGKTDKVGTPVLIGIIMGTLILAGGTFYAVIFGEIPGGTVFRVIIGLITAGFLAALVIIVLRRIQEIHEEEPDDYRKY